MHEMSPLLESSLSYVGLGALVVANLLCVILVIMQLPGTWFMLGLTCLVAWWQWSKETIGPGTLVALVVLAVMGELIEMGASSLGAARAGGTRRGMLGAMAGGVLGAIAGSIFIPVLVLGTLLGASLGAGVGSVIGDRTAGRTWRLATEAGTGAAKGKLLGTIGKLVIAVTMWVVVTAAVLF